MEYSLEQDEPWVQGSIIPNINQFPILNMNEASKELEIPFHKVTLLILCSFPVVSEQILTWWQDEASKTRSFRTKQEEVLY